MQAGAGLLDLDVMHMQWSLPGHCHDYLKFYQLPNSNLFTPRFLFFSWEATSETYDPWVFFLIYLPLRSTFLLHLCSDLLIQQPKNTLLQFIVIYFVHVRSINLLQIYLTSVFLSWGAVPRKGLTTPLIRRVARISYLCAGAIYIVLLGSPTGSITLVSYRREIPTTAVLHHPFLFGEIPM